MKQANYSEQKNNDLPQSIATILSSDEGRILVIIFRNIVFVNFEDVL
jgi:hypothetical protein